MKRLFTFALAAVAASGILFPADARLADADGDGLKDRRARLHRLDLTDEQRREIRDSVTKLRDSGASRTEIVTAVGYKPQGLGVDLPEDFEARQAEKGQRAELRDELRARVHQLRDSGASRDDIRAEVKAFREANGIEGGPGKSRHGKGRHGKGMKGPGAGRGPIGGDGA